MDEEMKDLVRKGYNTVAKSDYYWKKIENFDLGIYQDFKKLVNEGKVLELGCGPGTTVGLDLIETGFDYLGVDISDENIARAKTLVENAENYFIREDMMRFTAEQDEGIFDGVITMFADFHVPRGQRVQLYVNIMRILKPGGYLLFTSHPSSWEGYIDDYAGAKMYWSLFSNQWYDITMRELGYKFVSSFRNEYTKYDGKIEVQYFMLFQKPTDSS
jgi:SAM-dependent methyltransferase